MLCLASADRRKMKWRDGARGGASSSNGFECPVARKERWVELEIKNEHGELGFPTPFGRPSVNIMRIRADG